MKILVTGSRVYADYDKVKQAIIDSGATEVIHGNALGADTLARRACLELKIDEHRYPANWELHGRGAGPKRNQQMLDDQHTKDNPISLVLAFPVEGSIGTYDMIKRAEKADIKVKIMSNNTGWCPKHHIEDNCKG